MSITQGAPSGYKVMSFSIEKAGAKYHRSRATLFHDMIHRESECHVDDMMAKSQAEQGHPVDRGKLFDRLR